MRHRIILLAGAVFFAAIATAIPANAADTDTTFDVTTGSLAIDAPPTAALGSAIPGATINAALGTVSVTDTRGIAPAPWTATVSSTDFTSTTVGTQIIPVADVDYWSGNAGTTGDGTFTAGQATSADRVPLPLTTAPPALTAFTHADGTGGNTATWNPGIVISVPATIQVGTYEGTVTHQVA